MKSIDPLQALVLMDYRYIVVGEDSLGRYGHAMYRSEQAARTAVERLNKSEHRKRYPYRAYRIE